MVVEVDSPRFGKYLRHGAIIDFSDAPARLGHGSFAGEHTVRVVRELGYSDAQITELRARHVIDWEEVERLPSAPSLLNIRASAKVRERAGQGDCSFPSGTAGVRGRCSYGRDTRERP